VWKVVEAAATYHRRLITVVGTTEVDLHEERPIVQWPAVTVVAVTLVGFVRTIVRGAVVHLQFEVLNRDSSSSRPSAEPEQNSLRISHSQEAALWKS
jgi:hypothetical protein